MKDIKDDIEFRNLLKCNRIEVGENEWFTKRVLNRLPEKRHSYRWAEKLLYITGVVLCIIFWTYFFKTSSFSVITGRDVLNMCVMAGVTLVVIAQSIKATFSFE